MGHVIPKSGNAAHITEAVSTFVSAKSHEVFAVGCDETNTNTSNRGGVVTLLEHTFNRPLQWLKCQLHANELPLRHLINHLDGETNGPIGRKLVNCESIDVVIYKIIESKLCIHAGLQPLIAFFGYMYHQVNHQAT